MYSLHCLLPLGLPPVVPEPIVLTGSDLRELSGVVAAKLTFSAEFTNVLLISVQLEIVQSSCTAALIEFDKEFMVSQM